MNKKPILLVLLLALVLVALIGFMAAPQVAEKPVAQGEVKLEVKGAPSTSSGTEGQVKLIVI